MKKELKRINSLKAKRGKNIRKAFKLWLFEPGEFRVSGIAYAIFDQN